MLNRLSLSHCQRALKKHARSIAQLTASHYDVQRGQYKKLEQADIDYFRTVLGGDKGMVTSEEDLEPFNQDWMNKYRGQSKLMLKPNTTQQVSDIVKYCNEQKLAIVPQGGNTGLVGGSVPVFDEIIVSTAGLNKIHSFDEVSGVLTADAGVILQTADDFLRERDYIFPLDLGAKGSCHIGGNVATNAGGLRLLRYGSLHGSVLGLEAVLPDGRIFNNMSKLRKDNTGYDLKQLFIGSEGTLGIITGVTVACPPKPSAVNVAFMGLESYEDVQKLFTRARKHLSEILSSFECMDKSSLDMVRRHNTVLSEPLEGHHPFTVLIETSGSNSTHDEEKLNAFLEAVMEEGLIGDGVVAQDEAQINNLWLWRETVPEASTKLGGVYKYDVSLPLSAMYELVDVVQARLEEKGLVGESEDFPAVKAFGYGHIGDGNLHLNISCRRYTEELEAALEPFVFEFVAKQQGSVSAEHGVGFQKVHALHYSKSPVLLEMMKSLKHHYDPNNIMNPYKYLEN